MARLGRYELGRVLGEGGEGRVYEAVLVGPGGLRKPVALKVLHTGQSTITREARIGGLLRHRNLVDVFEVSSEEGQWFCAIELCAGGALTRHLPLPPQAVVDVGLQVCAALQYAHRELGLVHLDLKPANLLLSGATVKVADLGIARADGVAQGAPIRGTRGYMSPEQQRGDPLDARADIYALGVTLVELATGALPGVSQTLDLETITADDPQPGQSRDVPDWLAPVVDRCLQPEAEDRWPDMSALAGALKALVVGGADLRGHLGWTPQAAPRVRGTNLAPELDPLVGRDVELTELAAALDQPAWITLKGPAGVGKTRLAAAAAWRYRGRTYAEAWFCDLADVQGVDGLLRAMGRTLGVPLGAGDSAAQIERIGRILERRGPAVIVLDNFEQIIHLVPHLVQWRLQAPELRCLVTSRQKIGLDDEAVLEVGPLRDEDAALLLVHRARSRGVDLVDHPRLLELVTRLDGLPLALELAAGRLGVLDVAEVLERLNLSLLRGATDDRHSTLQRALDGSWDLLGPTARHALAQLSVFHGSFSLAAAEGVLHLDQAPVDVLGELVAASLVHVAGPERLRLLVGVREYAEGHLSRADLEHTRARHAEWFARYGTDDAILQLEGERATELGALYALEVDNFAAAARAADNEHATYATLAAYASLQRTGPLSLAVRLIKGVLARDDLGSGLRCRLKLALSLCHKMAGRLEEGEESAAGALAAARSSGEPQLVGMALATRGNLANLAGRLAEARSDLERAVAMGRSANDGVLCATALIHLGNLLREQSDLEGSRRCYAEVLELTRGGSRRARSICLRNLAILDLDQGRVDQAEPRLTLALAQMRKLGDRRGESLLLCDLGATAMDTGRLDLAAERYHESLRICEDVGELGMAAAMHNNLGLLERVRGGDPRPHFQVALEVAERNGHPRSIGIAAGNLGCAVGRLGERAQARALLGRALELHRGIDFFYGIPYWLQGIALLDIVDGELDSAARHIDEAVELARAYPPVLASVLPSAVRVYLARGEVRVARERSREAEALSPGPSERAAIRAAAAWVAVRSGDSEADSLVQAAMDSPYARPGTATWELIEGARAEL